jgi:hypothetical protein
LTHHAPSLSHTEAFYGASPINEPGHHRLRFPDNATEEYPEGDEVQAIESWTPPATWAGITDAMIDAVLANIDGGTPNGRRYSDAPNAKDRAAWQVVQQHCPDRNEAQCREIIKTSRRSASRAACREKSGSRPNSNGAHFLKSCGYMGPAFRGSGRPADRPLVSQRLVVVWRTNDA